MIGDIINELIYCENEDVETFNIPQVREILKASSNLVYYYRQTYTKDDAYISDSENDFYEDVKFRFYLDIINKYKDQESVSIVYYSTPVTTPKENVFKEFMFLYIAVYSGNMTPFILKTMGKEVFDHIIINSLAYSTFDTTNKRMDCTLINNIDIKLIHSCEEWIKDKELSEALYGYSSLPFSSTFGSIFKRMLKEPEFEELAFYDLVNVLNGICEFYELGEYDLNNNICNTIITMPIIEKMLTNLSNPEYNDKLVRKIIYHLSNNTTSNICNFSCNKYYKKQDKMLILTGNIKDLNDIINNQTLVETLPIIKEIAIILKENIIKYIGLYINDEIECVNKKECFITERVLKRVAKYVFETTYNNVYKRHGKSVEEINEKAPYNEKLRNSIKSIMVNRIL